MIRSVIFKNVGTVVHLTLGWNELDFCHPLVNLQRRDYEGSVTPSCPQDYKTSKLTKIVQT